MELIFFKLAQESLHQVQTEKGHSKGPYNQTWDRDIIYDGHVSALVAYLLKVVIEPRHALNRRTVDWLSQVGHDRWVEQEPNDADGWYGLV